MGIKDELHDLRLVGVREYLWLSFGLRWDHRFEDWRMAQEKARAERKERRLMKTSTYDALSEGVGDVIGDEQAIQEDLLADTIVVERRRWIERAQWITLLFVTAGLGYVGGWYSQPTYAPDPLKCTVVVQGAGKEASVVECEGVPE